jgi:hypothetical protein
MQAALAAGQPLPRDAVLTENDDDFVPMRARTLTTLGWKITLYAGCDDGYRCVSGLPALPVVGNELCKSGDAIFCLTMTSQYRNV